MPADSLKLEKNRQYATHQPNNQLYALCDFETLQKRGVSILGFIDICKKFDAKLIQYRDKVNQLTIQKQNLEILKNNCDIPIIVNDKLELIEFADGIHMGQEDIFFIESGTLDAGRGMREKNRRDKELAIKFIRKKIGDKILGISTHNEVEILEANSFDIDYIGLGAYRPTNTKAVDNILGSKLSYLAKISIHPVAAIGGVKIYDDIENVTYNVVGSGLL